MREPGEYESERIPGALLYPLSSFDPECLPLALRRRVRARRHRRSRHRRADRQARRRPPGASYLERLRVPPGSRLRLADFDPGLRDRHEAQRAAAGEVEHYRERLVELVRRRSLRIRLQGLDTAGKDGTIKHILSAMNPQGCIVAQFRRPSAEEAAHDLTLRINAFERGLAQSGTHILKFFLHISSEEQLARF